jgi:Ca-activated chloride channel family protein
VSHPLDPAVLAAALQTFRGVHQRGATLAVFDSSGSMAAIVPRSGGKSKLQVAADAARSALPLFADDSEVGLWRFATRIDGDRDYVEMVPLGPVGDLVDGKPRRDRIAQAIAAIPPSTDTGLYDTTLAAFARLTATYVPGKVNQVVILTDGRNDDPGSISLDELVTRISELFDPRRPVQIITIGYGADADAAALQRISAATGAKSYQSRDPNDIFEVLVNALTDRTG